MNAERYIGRPLDSLSLKERWQLAGSWIALEIYTPQRVPLRTIEALGPSVQDCSEQLRRRGLDTSVFEFSRLAQPYVP